MFSLNELKSLSYQVTCLKFNQLIFYLLQFRYHYAVQTVNKKDLKGFESLNIHSLARF